jgi:paired amphipathic helix protein Sin3a
MYRLMYADEHWYLFFRYHQILCDRLHKVYKYSLQIAENETADQRSREQSVAEALKLRNKSDIPVDEYYPTFLDIARNLLDGNMDAGTYEDQMREMFGIQAYIVFTLDKVVHNCVRQLQYLVQDEKSISIKHLYSDECKSGGGAGGKVVNMTATHVMNAELAYQKKAEALLTDEHSYKIIIVILFFLYKIGMVLIYITNFTVVKKLRQNYAIEDKFYANLFCQD